MRTEDDESAPSKSGGAGNKSKRKKQKNTKHQHIGPNVRAFKAGMAFCPTCDADKALRLTSSEILSEMNARDAAMASRRNFTRR